MNSIVYVVNIYYLTTETYTCTFTSMTGWSCQAFCKVSADVICALEMLQLKSTLSTQSRHIQRHSCDVFCNLLAQALMIFSF